MSPSDRPTKNDRREEARAAAAALREKQAKAQARQRTIAIAALVAGLVVVGVLVAVILNQGKTSAGAQVTPEVSSARGGVVFDESGVVIPPADQDTTGDDGSTTAWPVNSGDTPVVSVYFDFMCPYCGQFETAVGPTLDELAASGEILLDSHPVSILDRFSAGTGFSTRSAAAAWAVAEGSPEHYTAFVEAMMAQQPAENTAGLSDEEIAAIATGVGVPQEVADGLADGTFTWWATQATDLASQDLGSLATPTVLIDGVKLDPSTTNYFDPETLKAAIAAAQG
ncbi:DsbA family protein [Actinotalea sp.]|uniref:DsbA family protein n=1 Tax=Actinotalea sp. TaxID=1872145 RepID=UPI003566E9FA